MKLTDAKKMIDEIKDTVDIEVSGCSFCVTLILKRGQDPAPCPVCGASVTRRHADDPRATDEDKELGL